MSDPKINTAFVFTVPLVNASARPSFKAAPTIATGDFKVSIGDGAFTDLATLPTVTPAAGTAVKISLSASEMNSARITVQCIDQTTPKEWDDVIITIQTATVITDDIGAAGAGLTAVPWNASWDAEVQSECADAITAASLATASALATAQADLDTITGTDGATLATTQANYAPAKAGDNMGTVSSVTGSVGSVTGLTASNLDATVSSRMATTHLAATAGKLNGVALVDVTTTNTDMRGTDSAYTGTPPTPPTAASIADAVWDEPVAGHVGAGTFGATDAAILADTNELQTDDTPAAIAALSIPTAAQNADALLNRDMSAVSDTNARTPLNALRFLRNKWSVAGTTLTVTKEDDSTSAWTATVTTDAAADPITGNDPA